MSDKSSIVQEIRVLWNGYIEGQLDAQQEKRFDALLVDSREARAEYIGLMNMHSLLSCYLLPKTISDEMEFDKETSDIESLYTIDLAGAIEQEITEDLKNKESQEEASGHLVFDFMQSIPGYFSHNTFHFLILLALLLPSLFALLSVLNGSKHDSLTGPIPAKYKAVARLEHPTIATNQNSLATKKAVAQVVQVVSPIWGKDTKKPIDIGSYLAEGTRCTLSSGFIELAFLHNARVIVRGPATFILTSDGEIQLDSGQCVAKVPPKAVGFTIEANGTQIIDLGTEFGVKTSDNKETDIYVFKGKVELSLKDAPQEGKIELTKDEGICASVKKASITPKKIDTDRFTRSLTASGVVTSLPTKNVSFGDPNIVNKNWIKPDGTLRSVPIVYWNVKTMADCQQIRDNRFELGVAQENLASILTLSGGTWISCSLGKIQPEDVGHCLGFSVDYVSRGFTAGENAKVTVAFATDVSLKNRGSLVGKMGTIGGDDAKENSQTAEASLLVPPKMVGSKLFIIIQAEGNSPEADKNLYLIENLNVFHEYPALGTSEP